MNRALLRVSIAILLSLSLLFVAVYFQMSKPDNALLSGEHPTLHDEITEIKDRLTINITQSDFTNPIRTCDFYELREIANDEYFQTTINYWVFQNGKGTNGDVEAFVEIYNKPNRTDLYVVEVTRNCWNELTVYLDGTNIITFPTVVNDTLSLGYLTFEVKS